MLYYFDAGSAKSPVRIPSNVMSTSKITSIEALSSNVRRLRSEGKRIVFTNGCFDILHSGHIELFRSARRLGDALVVAINSDRSVHRIKGEKRPIFNEDERSEILSALEMVDFVTIFGEDTPLRTILEIRPDVLVKGADWEEKGIVGQEEVEAWGGQVVPIRLVEGRSTSGIIDRIVSLARPDD